MNQQQNTLIITDDYDKEFVHLLIEIESYSKGLKKQQLLVIDKWCQKLCEITTNLEWKKNRNLHAIYLLDMLMNKRIDSPYKKFPKEESLPTLSKSVIKSILSDYIKEVNFANHGIIFERVEENGKVFYLIKEKSSERQNKFTRNPKATNLKQSTDSKKDKSQSLKNSNSNSNSKSNSKQNFYQSSLNIIPEHANLFTNKQSGSSSKVPSYLSPKPLSCSKINKINTEIFSSYNSYKQSNISSRNSPKNIDNKERLCQLKKMLAALQLESSNKSKSIIKNDSTIKHLELKLASSKKTMEILILNKNNTVKSVRRNKSKYN